MKKILISKKIDDKPRLKKSPNMRTGTRARAKSRFLASRASANVRATGTIAMIDRTPRGRKIGVVVGEIVGAHQLGYSPAVTFSHYVRRALGAALHPRPMVKIYDGDENLVAIFNPETRVRTPIDAPGARPRDSKEP